ncbi:DUF2550 domain-containing protein [Nocardiopsis algeriensis]|uniref:DUF2550 family protein n=1 Tax=Nocardiopsis algeriensis TaxID=1478215 RepID=A0A841IT88_9ACTN|nr:DUF2550 domain-containing protein [Nocardiopsis algeriensis]MBB6120466.1 hypothetical protein [Nocardiopsis algeriensis]
MEQLLLGTPWVEPVQWVFLALLLLAVALAATGFLRRWILLRRGGAVECHLRTVGVRGRRGSWRIGMCRYGSEHLDWFPIFSLRPRPTAQLSRRGLVIVGRRLPEEGEQLPADSTVVRIGWAGDDGADPEEAAFEIAMGEATLTGFLSWVESLPPGTPWEA